MPNVVLSGILQAVIFYLFLEFGPVLLNFVLVLPELGVQFSHGPGHRIGMPCF